MIETTLTLMEVDYLGEKHLMAMRADNLKWVGTLGPIVEWDGRLNVVGKTSDEVAALAEEIKAKAYDSVRAYVGTMLEVVQGEQHAKGTPEHRLFRHLLELSQRDIMTVIERRVPEITAAMLDEKRRERERAEAERDRDTLAVRRRWLQEELNRTDRDLKASTHERDLADWCGISEILSDRGLSELLEEVKVRLEQRHSDSSVTTSQTIGLPKIR